MHETVNLNTVFIPSEDVVARSIEGELIIVPLVNGIGDMEDSLFTLNETGRAIWERLDGKCNLSNIAIDLSTIYEAPLDEMEQDVVGLMVELVKRKIVAKISSE